MKKLQKIFASFAALIIAAGVSFPATVLADSETVVTVGPNEKYKTITAALNSNTVKKAGGDVVINVKPNTYSENVTITKDHVTIKGISDSKGSAILDGSSVSGWTMISVEASNVTVENMKITGLYTKSASHAAYGIEVVDGVHDIVISNCEIYSMGCKYKGGEVNAQGILVNTYHDDQELPRGIKNVTIDGCSLHNLVLGNSEALAINGCVENFTISNNHIYGCDNIGIDVIGYENVDEDKPSKKLIDVDRAHNGTIYGNTVENISSKENKTYDSACAGGIYVDGGYDISIYDNYVYNCDIGIELASEHLFDIKGVKYGSTDDIRVYNNTLINNDNLAGISIGGSVDDDDINGYANKLDIHNNTVVNQKEPCFNIQLADSDTNKIYDNIFYHANGKIYANEAGASNNVFENNLINKNTKPSGHSTKDVVDTGLKCKVNGKDGEKHTLTITASSKTDLSKFGCNAVSDAAEVTEVPEVTEAPTPVVTEAPAPTEAPAVTEVPVVTEAPVITPEPSDVDPVETEDEPTNEDPNDADTEEVISNDDNNVIEEGDEPSYDIHTNSSFYEIDETDDICKISYKKSSKKKENWKTVIIDFGGVDLDKYSTVTLTVIPSREGMNLGITNQDENNPIFYRNHWDNEGKFSSTEEQTVTITLTEENKNGIYLYFDATKKDKNDKKQTFTITDISFE